MLTITKFCKAVVDPSSSLAITIICKESNREIKKRRGAVQAQQPKSKMQIYSTNHYRRQASLLLKKRKEKPVYGPPVRGFGGNPGSPEGEFTPHAVNAC
jgi:hypothetical protein